MVEADSPLRLLAIDLALEGQPAPGLVERKLCGSQNSSAKRTASLARMVCTAASIATVA